MTTTPKRYFGTTKTSGQPFVCGVAGTIAIGMEVSAPDADGQLHDREVLRLGEPFERSGELYVYGYLADGFRSTRNLRADGWTLKQISLLGPAEIQRPNPVKASGPPTSLWCDATVARVQRTESFQELVRTPEQRAAAQTAAAKANATKQARISQILSDMRVTVTKINSDQLLTLAIADANRAAEMLGEGLVSEESDPALLRHIQIWFVCQYLTRCDDRRGKFGRLISRARAQELIDAKVLASIADAYPHLTAAITEHSKPVERGAASS